MQTAASLPMLVSSQWLHENLKADDLRLFDCTGCVGRDRINRGREWHYEQQHIAGAAYLDVASPYGEFSDPDSALPFTWPALAHLQTSLQRLGISHEHRVILYAGPNPTVAGSGVSWATRAWWILHHHGIDCALLDGGWRKWQQENRQISQQPHAYPASNCVLTPIDLDQVIANRDQVLLQQQIQQQPQGKQQAQGSIIDSLSADSFAGRLDRAYGTFGQRKGHISGAVNVHYEDLLNPDDGTFLPVTELRRRFLDAGVDLTRPSITYCGGGIGASVTAFVLKLIGAAQPRIYDGSLNEWANDPACPMTDPSL